jgi:uncharacterized membrane protein YfcA
MEITATSGELIQLVIALLLSGAFTGVLAGLFGIGGGAIIVPILFQAYTMLGVDPAICMHISVATSMAIIIPTGLRSFLAHRQRGTVDTGLVKRWILPTGLGVIVASIIAAFLPGKALSGIFAVIAALIAVRMLVGGEKWRLGEDLPREPYRSIAGGLIGFVSTFMGIGGGNLVNAYMTLYGRPMIQAVGTSSAVGLIISIPAVIGYMWGGWGVPGLPPLSAGYVNLLGMAVMIPVSVLAAPYGVKLAHALSRRQLEVSFGIFLTLVSARFFWTLIPW